VLDFRFIYDIHELDWVTWGRTEKGAVQESMENHIR
jgi:hypothetical protein